MMAILFFPLLNDRKKKISADIKSKKEGSKSYQPDVTHEMSHLRKPIPKLSKGCQTAD